MFKTFLYYCVFLTMNGLVAQGMLSPSSTFRSQHDGGEGCLFDFCVTAVVGNGGEECLFGFCAMAVGFVVLVVGFGQVAQGMLSPSTAFRSQHDGETSYFITHNYDFILKNASLKNF